MNGRIQELAGRFRQLNDELIAIAQMSSVEQWQAKIDNNGATAGHLAHHVAVEYPYVGDWIKRLGMGQAVEAEYDELHQHPEHPELADAHVTAEMLRGNGEAVHKALLELEDGQLEGGPGLKIKGGGQMSLLEVIERLLLGHTHEHLEQIRQRVSGHNPARPAPGLEGQPQSFA